jgi:hypothetical protein
VRSTRLNSQTLEDTMTEQAPPSRRDFLKSLGVTVGSAATVAAAGRPPPPPPRAPAKL